MDASVIEMDPLDEVKQSVIHQAYDITVSSVQRLRELWGEIFDESICQEHISRLPDHIQTFFNEVYEESESRKRKILQTIGELRREAATLRRLLREDEQEGLELPGMPLHLVQITLDRSLEAMREKLKVRHDQIDEYLFEQETLCEELGETPRHLSKDPLPSEAEMCEFRSYLDNLRTEKLQRFDDIAAMRREIKTMMTQLAIVPQSERQEELINARNFPPTRRNLVDLRNLHEQVVTWFEDLKDNIDKIRGKLQNLWNALDVDPAVVKRYERYNDYTQTTFDKLFAELDRCETLRRENIQKFIDQTRVEIVQWWDKCLKSDEERSRFSTFKSEVYNEDLLTLHEMELNDLKDYYRNNENIFQLVEQRREMWEKMTLLEQKSNDPSRYNNRGGKLLEEEKERKRISIQLPKIESRLLEACKRYEEENKRKFTIFGRYIGDVIQEQWKEREEGKLKISSARKKANMATPTAASGSRTLARTPRTADNMMKHTSIPGRTRLAALPNATGAANTTSKLSASKHLSTSKLSAAGTKRKMPSPKTGAVKRSLLKDLNSPRTFLKPSAPVSANKSSRPMITKSPGKVPTMKVYDRNCTKRRSRRKSSHGGKRRRSVSKQVPEIVVTSDSSLQSVSVSYEHFENFFEQNTPNRSSVMPGSRPVASAIPTPSSARSRITSRRNQLRSNQPFLSSTISTHNNNNLQPLSTPSKITFRNPSASSTMLATTTTSSMRSPASVNSTASGRKLMPASKNCPIIF